MQTHFAFTPEPPAAPTVAWPASHVRASYVGERPPSFAMATPDLVTTYWFANVAHHPFFDSDKEHLAVMLLNTKFLCVGWNMVSIGSLNESIAHPREVVRPAIVAAAYAIVLAHNHPSGDSTPSDADMRVTRRLKEVCELLQIKLLDHVIVGRAPTDRRFRFRESGII
jgi:DNA repair protein RadC